MADEQSSDGTGTGDLPEPIREWLADRAAEEGTSEEEFLARLLRAGGTADGNTTGERLAAVEEAVEALRADLDEKIDDVRERVVQVKREVDGKAPADHDHPELADRTGGTGTPIPDPGAGEEDGVVDVLEHLVETADELEHKLDRLARVTVGLRGVVDELSESEAESAAVADLARSANVHGARRADCGSCGEPVDVGLLSEPRCPHCAEPFEAFVPKQGLFGSHVLEVGTSPALEAGDDLEGIPDPDTDSERDDGEDGPLSGIDFEGIGTAEEETTAGSGSGGDAPPADGTSPGSGADAGPGGGEEDGGSGSPRPGDE